MQYLLLIYSQESQDAQKDEAARQQMFQEYGVFTASIKEKGQMIAGDALHPISTAKSVTVRDGNVITTDGPFAETKEQLGGYYLVDVESEEEAIELASRIPTAQYGTVEVRPVLAIDW